MSTFFAVASALLLQNENPLIYENVDIKQFENADNSLYEFEVTASEDCEFTRCGRNLLDIKTIGTTGWPHGVDTSNNMIVLTAKSGWGTWFWSGHFLKGKDITFKSKSTLIQRTEDRTDSALYWIQEGDYYKGLAITDSLPPIGEVVEIAKQFQMSESGSFGICQANDPEGLGSDYISEWSYEQNSLTLGSTEHPYEPYNGETITLKANVPTTISALDGVNTLFTDNGTLTIKAYG
ncbi:MAG: hypothetical protein R3Y09_06680 [Clostridia bacterium]